MPAQTSWPRNSWGGKGLFSLQFHIAVHHQGSQDWNSSRSGSRSWCRGHGGMFFICFICLLPLVCSACSLIEPRLPVQRWHHPQGALPTWSPIEKMPSWISWRHFPNWASFFCDNSSLCQVDTQNQPAHNPSLRLSSQVLLDCDKLTKPAISRMKPENREEFGP